ncbi:UDP-N-acetylmuramate dehydrogenase [Streptomyces murinus]|uniref:UDP-N-acetylmuramate dehydrogenase n=1 Tax=Streptomyces murinus TaxID=33900 RepID=UPI002E1499EC|nr:UDP-N-acetylmuramate dehydrogenase [Streptomyces murinus]WSI85336.1 UDP-N-acetylmuramate dehydrogenase [Streptomyces murinus]
MGELLADHTTLRFGGPADLWLSHTDSASWSETIRALEGRRPFILGGGSNTLADDTGYPGAVVRMANPGITARSVGDGQVELTVQSGEPLGRLVVYAVTEGLSGVEYLGGIPGTTGAAPVQNTGAYGQQIADCLTSVTAWDWALGRMVRLDPATCRFRYRSSVFKTHPGRWAILAITLRLSRSDRAAPVSYGHLAHALDLPLGSRPPLHEAAAGVLADREARGLSLPESGPDARQAGSVFLNPPVDRAQASMVRATGGRVYRDGDGMLRASAGWLLEQSGYSPGVHVGPGVYCSASRALTVTARDDATGSSFLTCLHRMARTVRETSGIELRPEPVRPPAEVRT